jgi:hypothetical protein
MVQLSIATLMDIALDSNGILSAKEIEYEDPLFIYPNPVEDILFFNLSTSKIKYNSAIITDVTGKKVLNFTDISNLSFLNLSGLNQGTYFLTLISGTQSKKPLKIIKI